MYSILQLWLNRAASTLDRSCSIIRLFSIIAIITLAMMVLLTFVDVMLRYFFNRPLAFSLELIQVMAVIVVFFGLAYTQLYKGHIAIDVLVNLLSQRARLVIDSIGTILSIGLFCLIIWRSSLYALGLQESHQVTETLGMPVSPFAFVVPFGSILLVVVLLRDLLNNLVEGTRLRLGAGLWVLLFGVPVFVLFGLIIMILNFPLPQVSPLIIGIIGIAGCLSLFFFGIPVSFAMAMVGFLGILYLRGLEPSSTILGSVLFRTTANYTWVPTAFFVLMGWICFFLAFGKDLYHAANSWLGRLPGGLSIATITASAGLAAVVGDPVSSVVTMGTVALPEMKKYKYSDRLSVGSVAAGGCLGPLIPPSIMFIIYGVLTEQSIGDLFIAGIVPGILLAVSWILLVYFQCRKNPEMGPRGSSSSLAEKLVSIKAGWPILLLFMLVIGGIYMGLFTPTEGGAIGGAGAIIIGLILRRVTWQRLISALLEATKVTCMVFMIIGCAMIFGYFIVLSKLPLGLAAFVTGSQLSPLTILLIVLGVYFVLGCFISIIPLVLITVPIFAPIAANLGWDPIWFGVVIVMMTQMAGITPPYGINLFALKGVAKDISIGTMYRGIVPFILVMAVVIAIIVAFPQVSIFLPNLIK